MADNRALLMLRYLLTAVIIGSGIAIFEILIFASVGPKKKFVVYKLQILVVAYLVLYYVTRSLWQKLCRLPSSILSSHACNCWKGLLVIYLGLVLLGPLHSFYMQKEPALVAIAVGICFGSSLILCFLLFLMRISVNGLRMLKRGLMIEPDLVQDKWQIAVCTFATVIITWTAYCTAISPPIIVRKSVPITKMPTSLSGTRLALLSDIHLGPTVGFTMLERAVSITNSLKPDLVIIAGDLADGPVKDLKDAAIALKNLAAPRGLYFVTGNHEYYTSDVEGWFKFLESLGFHILHNSNVKVRSAEDDWFCLLGTDDLQANKITYEGHGMNLSQAYQGCDSEHPAILVAHQPNAAKIALDSEYPIQLVLSGHTHGGQVFPVTIFAYIINAFLAGLYQYGSDSYVYVSQGTVYYGPPLRFWTRPEITEITLVSA